MQGRQQQPFAAARPVSYRPLLLAAALLALTGCSTYSLRHYDMHRSLASGDPGLALQMLEMRLPAGRDRTLYDLNKGMLLRLTGDYTASNELLESAKQEMQRLSATSISENLSALAINEATRSYAGQPYEQLLLHAYKALNYLSLDQADGARVEMLQADVKMREWTAGNDIEGILASAFVRYLAGVVFEINREWSEALIAYRKAYEIYQETDRPVPVCLQKDLLRLTAHLGLADEHKRLKASFNREAWRSVEDLQRQAELIVFYHQGLVSELREQVIFSYSPELSHSVQIAVPFYELPVTYFPPAHIQAGGVSAETELLENVDQLARDNLAVRLPGITLRAVTRMAVKKKVAHEARQENALAGFFADVVGLATERADTRSWSTLPSSVQVARLVLPPGEHRIHIGNTGVPLNENTDETRSEATEGLTVKLSPGDKKVLSIHATGQLHYSRY
ncbi:MAG TPA: hypothetical protein VF268_15460 [Gammaproteobacteria bacterium]